VFVLFLLKFAFFFVVGVCDEIQLDGRASSGFVGRTGTYLFNASTCSGVVVAGGSSWTLINNGLLDPLPMDPNSVCLFTLIVTNFMQIASLPTSSTVSKAAVPIPLVSIGAQIPILRSQVLYRLLQKSDSV
jgi:hypothetical protein